MRSWGALLITVSISACSAHARPVSPASPSARLSPASPSITPSDRLAAADVLVRAGCLECLLAALHEFDALRDVPDTAVVAAERRIATAILIDLRERELGIEDGGYLERAEMLAASSPALSETMTPIIEIARTMPSRRSGDRSINDDEQLVRSQQRFRNRDAGEERLYAQADIDPLSAYLWLGFNCVTRQATTRNVEGWMQEIEAWSDVPLLGFKRATCGDLDADALDGLLAADSRFVEVRYFLALSATLRGRLNEALNHLERAYEWRPRWPAVTTSLGNLYLAVEEFDQAIDFFGKTVAMIPGHPDALLGTIRALTYAERFTEALVAVDGLLALERWHVGDARYWRAFNEMQLGRNDEAWSDVEAASRLQLTAQVSKLAGMIAYRREQIDVSRARFEESRTRNPNDCETSFYLGVVLAELKQWDRTAEVLVEASTCLEAVEARLQREIDGIRTSEDPPLRQQRQIARREEWIAIGRRRVATSRFNIAVASFNLSRMDDARRYAELVADDEQFGARARQLLARLH